MTCIMERLWRSIIFSKMFSYFLLILVWACQVKPQCPDQVGPFARVGPTPYYISHDATRQDFVSHQEADELCRQHGMELATIPNMVTFTTLGRALEIIVTNDMKKDSWYWLAATFDAKQNRYIWTKSKQPVTIGNFLQRNKRPAGLGTHLTHRNKYLPEANVTQCLALALPWPLFHEQSGTKF